MLAARSVTSGKVSHGNVETPIGSAYRLEFVSTFLCSWCFLILMPRGVLLFELLLLWVSTPPWGSGDLGGKVLLGFLGCADCDVLNARESSGVTCCADLRAGLCSSSRRHRTSPSILLSVSNIMHVTVFILKINTLSCSVFLNIYDVPNILLTIIMFITLMKKLIITLL